MENVQPDRNDSCHEAVGDSEKTEKGTGYSEGTGRTTSGSLCNYVQVSNQSNVPMICVLQCMETGYWAFVYILLFGVYMVDNYPDTIQNLVWTVVVGIIKHHGWIEFHKAHATRPNTNMPNLVCTVVADIF